MLNEPVHGRGERLLDVRGLTKHFPVRSGAMQRQVAAVRAVDDVDLFLRKGETLGLVGESGSGKSTTGRLILRLLDPTAGRVVFDGLDITDLNRRQMRPVRRDLQIMFQDPYSSLNPKMTVEQIVAEPIVLAKSHGGDLRTRVSDLLEMVGLDPMRKHRYPREFSGGQRQRIGIARALAIDPKLMVLDEPVSALDVSTQAQIVNLLRDLQANLGVAFLFIAHDLAVVRHISHRIAVMYLGRIVETGNVRDIFRTPSHPYTQALLSAIPISHPGLRGKKVRIPIEGDTPNPNEPPSGCRFRTRCFKAEARCAVEEPGLIPVGEGNHAAACFFAEPMDILKFGEAPET